MGLATLKGKILEYTIRNILLRCGFTPVIADGLFIYDQGLLQFINGKGAAHDADVLMNPPIQMPFGYPSRLLFECKAYDGNISLPLIRNISGLREDINSFEIVTENFLVERRNNRRRALAVHDRKRHHYQVGIASLQSFTKPATEFAAHNKIPIFSLQETFPNTGLIDLINNIPANFDTQIGELNTRTLIDALSEKTFPSTDLVEQSIVDSQQLRRLFRLLHEQLNRVHVGMLESGDLIFLTLSQEHNRNEDIFSRQTEELRGHSLFDTYSTQMTIHWENQQSDIWQLDLGNNRPTYHFYLPKAIAREWDNNHRSKRSALQLKSQHLSRIIVFTKAENRELPFRVLTLNQEWISDALANV